MDRYTELAFRECCQNTAQTDPLNEMSPQRQLKSVGEEDEKEPVNSIEATTSHP